MSSHIFRLYAKCLETLTCTTLLPCAICLRSCNTVPSYLITLLPQCQLSANNLFCSWEKGGRWGTCSTTQMSLLFAGRTDMLTLMAMRWNQQKFNYLATSLTRRYQKVDMSHFFCLYSRCLLLYICEGITFIFCSRLLLFKGHKRPGKPASGPGAHENPTGSDTGWSWGLGHWYKRVGRRWELYYYWSMCQFCRKIAESLWLPCGLLCYIET